MVWVEGLNLPVRPERNLDAKLEFAIQAWNMLGGELNWNGLELVAEALGIKDIEWLMRMLITIRDTLHGRDRGKGAA